MFGAVLVVFFGALWWGMQRGLAVEGTRMFVAAVLYIGWNMVSSYGGDDFSTIKLRTTGVVFGAAVVATLGSPAKVIKWREGARRPWANRYQAIWVAAIGAGFVVGSATRYLELP
ncbi:hypothetical protein [Catenulispora yoronensis]|uniref:hypothetical protein n=1 Tax=Catenulispora yoronensis TaxID=450799 RepID=UPI0031DD6090